MHSRLLLRLARTSWGRWRRLGVGAVAAGVTGVGALSYCGDSQRQSLAPFVLAATPFGGSDKGSKGNRSRFNFVADAVALAAPAVVYIEIKDKRRVDLYSGEAMTMSNGSGFIVGEDGLVLTNAHVVVNAPKAAIQVRLQDGRTYIGRVEHVDMKSDLATVRIPVKGLPIMPLGRSSDLRPGEWVVALGSPLALNNTVTAGVISSVDRGSDELGMSGRDMLYIQTDAAITFGNSGGPLINLDGEAIGINSMKVTSGISFAIPIDYAKQFLSGTEKSPSISKKYLGITMLSLTPDIFKILRQKSHKMASSVTHGVLVWKVIMGSPAHGSGVYPGDIITHINDTPINSANDVYKLLEKDVSNGMKMKIVRDNKLLELNVSPEDQYN